MSSNVNLQMDGKIIKMMNEIAEISNKMEDVSQQVLKSIKEQDIDLENVRQQLVSNIQTKADFRDIDALTQRMH